jgi:hypothetical protein
MGSRFAVIKNAKIKVEAKALKAKKLHTTSTI